MNHPLQMLRYNAWANQTLLNRIKELPPETLHREVNTSFPTIAHAFAHMHMVDQIFYAVLSGTEMQEAMNARMPLADQPIHDTPDELSRRFAELNRQFETWIDAGPDLEQTFILNNPYVGPRETGRSEIVLHLVNHGTYHRGNVSTMLRQLGHASTMTDYIFFWYQDQAPAQ
ncbi:DinB family protein [Saccharibacillus sp. CPCC 101409]|uniref:DinB family protein n=1 Tax=Saccharibacillus sp. CPCC 101409 TaxID=3058041 RepID=UPI00267392E9|nr:DinB family protein [Saccharibacillus sp. CPCC 101409]MDO3411743.1 DinB family protein [Saccharibacillus sp. CPCC 101409]